MSPSPRTPTAATRGPSRNRPRRRKRRLHPLAISALMILAALAVTYYAFNQGLPFQHEFTVSAVVSNSVNVRSGDPVRIAGVDVGTVSGVAADGDASKIAFTVSSEGLPPHRNATVRIRDRLFLEGSYYLDLDPGTPSAPTLHDGATIPQSQTSSPVQFFQVLSTFDVATRADLTTLVATLAKGLAAPPGQPLSLSGAGGLKRAFPQAAPALEDAAVVTRSLRGTAPGDLTRLLSSASEVTGTLGANSAQLAQLVTGLDVSSRALVASDGALGQSIAGLDETLRSAPKALTAVDRALPPLTGLAKALDPSLQLAPPLVTALSGAVGQLTAVLAPVQRGHLLTSLKATFEQFPSLLSQLGGAFPITKQVTDCLRTHVTPVLQQQVPDGTLSSGHPVWQDFVHFLPGLAGASGGFDANGPYTRVLAAAGTNTLSGSTSGPAGGGGLLGTLAGVLGLGKVFATSPPGGSSLAGSRPQWVGDLTGSDFRPDVPCATQAVPSLAATAAAPDLRRSSSPAAPAMTRAQLRAAIASHRRDAKTPAASGR
ncbi:MAG TPA: MlaD family protein [Solirubrobacteraceae bacterium]